MKVKEIIEFIQDDEKLREERKKAKKNRDKYVGINSEFASRSSSYNDFSSSSSSSNYNKSSNFKSSFSNTSGMNDLDEKNWRSNNPSIQERISDITSKVKNILDTNNELDAASYASDNEDNNNSTTANNNSKFSDNLDFNDIPKRSSATTHSTNTNKIDLKVII